MAGIDTDPATRELIDEIKHRFTEVRCSEVQQLLAAMSNPVRFHILCALRVQPFTVTELVEISDGNLSNVSQQLKMMWLAGYLAKEKRGKQVTYRLADDRIKRLVGFLEELFPENGDDCSCED